jgi:hypothetical protein
MEGIVMSGHSISISVNVDTAEKWRLVWAKFSYLVQEMEKDYSYVSLSSVLLDDEEPPVVENENTMDVVRDALSMGGWSTIETDAVVNHLQNAGILFRERATK